MYLIVGLGNPESDYSKTRHNMGFNVINAIAKDFGIDIDRKKFNGLYNDYLFNGKKVIFLKPQTFMNLSGDCVKAFVDYYNIDLDNVCIIYDDVDLEPGEIRVRKKGSSGGHNGMKSIIENLNSEEFPRIRVGIGKPKNNENLIEYVIGYVSKEDLDILNEGVIKAKDALIEFLSNGIDSCMNKYN
ncbi:MAG: aminoacyl-tRNA hydrolase [Clostridia bacterium]|nr:aminoacyl-tRNA hydrolase [Clostridia bacterium]